MPEVTRWQSLLAFGAIVNSALYLGAVVAIALAEHNKFASRLGLATIGFVYLCHLMQLHWPHAGVARLMGWTSIVLGVYAGVALL